MQYPRMLIYPEKIRHNSRIMKEILAQSGIDTLAGVTKVFGGNPELAQKMLDGGVDQLADSRIKNIFRMRDLDSEKWLLRMPMEAEIEDVVRYADASFNTEMQTVRQLNLEAARQGRVHKVFFMVDLGDLREGYYRKERLMDAVEQSLKLKNIFLEGIGVNLKCYSGVIPTPETLYRLYEYREEILQRYNFKLNILSGGNSSTMYLLGKSTLPGINNLRLGESIVCGTEFAYGQRIPNTFDDIFVLEAQIVEVKSKPSIPSGKLGKNSYGMIPSRTDKGIRRIALAAVGSQDTDLISLQPLDEDLVINGIGSDLLIVDITESQKEYQVGDILSFKMEYMAILSGWTSEYVEKVFVM
ncbi:MAG: alanine/ornithine racemase family PLP-dependent enzyme [Tissierellia bacterium]|nr:alanine/ornithine racemase family PLP-dependent enzyme [Tissierellia bacterium]